MITHCPRTWPNGKSHNPPCSCVTPTSPCPGAAACEADTRARVAEADAALAQARLADELDRRHHAGRYADPCPGIDPLDRAVGCAGDDIPDPILHAMIKEQP